VQKTTNLDKGSTVDPQSYKCAICQKETNYHCPCDPLNSYCTAEHQMLHWEQGHWKEHEEEEKQEGGINKRS
jgi:hypothetical protein